MVVITGVSGLAGSNLSRALMFVVGYATNRWADAALLRLRRSGESGYEIPFGGLFD